MAGNMSKKMKTSNGLLDLVNLLEKLRILSEDDWNDSSNSLSERFKHVNQSIVVDLLKDAREKYCSFTLYQSFIQYCDCNSRSLIEARHIKNICDNQGFNIVTFTKMIATWMWDYSVSGMKTSKNTLYIVGDATTPAETLCNSIVNMFKCVHTADINNMDVNLLAKTYKETKMLYFPAIVNGMSFSNPVVNQILNGRDLQLVTEKGPVTIPPIKCLVHLTSLPNMLRVPTSYNQHFVIDLKTPMELNAIYHHELRSIIQSVSLAVDELDLDCQNPYAILCSSDDENMRCPACSRSYAGRINHPSVE
ncbi:protein ORF12 [Goose adenovirus 4]|uniref:Protein ORF12 n=1 Tax=Goose adenovirus 4 TaxID=1193422 RepID=I3PMM4_9ADEN|nr:protein ORF12 [Goose adenovirus 4]AFC40564.1 protein ORF12 [Goose adenovirus 4]